MRENPYREDREELKELLRQYQNLKQGRSHSFLEEEAFERIIDYFDDKIKNSLRFQRMQETIDKLTEENESMRKKLGIKAEPDITETADAVKASGKKSRAR